MKDFVTFEIAKKLKEKGFRGKCLSYYDVEDNVGLLYNTQYTDEALPCQYTDLLQCHNTGKAKYQIDDSGFCVDAPTISQVLKWLREEKELHIEIYMYHNCYLWEIYNTKIYDADFTQKSEKYSEIEYETYEEAALAGIEYTLDNLI